MPVPGIQIVGRLAKNAERKKGEGSGANKSLEQARGMIWWPNKVHWTPD